MSKEFVKERVLKYLMEDLLVPQDMIDTNVPLSEFEEGAEGVLDIIVNVVVKEHGEDYYVPVLIVTCVDEDFVMEGEALQKEIDFLEDVDNITTAGRMILTNGNEMMYADWTGEEYNTEASLPTYDQMQKEFFEMEAKLREEENKKLKKEKDDLQKALQSFEREFASIFCNSRLADNSLVDVMSMNKSKDYLVYDGLKNMFNDEKLVELSKTNGINNIDTNNVLSLKREERRKRRNDLF